MFLTTIGKPKNISLKECKQAIKYYGRQLLGNRLYNALEVTVEFSSKELSKNIYGYCDWVDTNHLGREFHLIIRPTRSKKGTLIVLAHEMIHVKQYAKGELKDYLRLNSVKWKGKVYDDEKIDYWDHPWEKEAHEKEQVLYDMFKQDLRG